eukprot:4233996-Alexandrium_andersonii.AAC.1
MLLRARPRGWLIRRPRARAQCFKNEPRDALQSQWCQQCCGALLPNRRTWHTMNTSMKCVLRCSFLPACDAHAT